MNVENILQKLMLTQNLITRQADIVLIVKKDIQLLMETEIFLSSSTKKKNDALSEADEILAMIEKNEIESKKYWDDFEKEIRPLEKELDKI